MSHRLLGLSKRLTALTIGSAPAVAIPFATAYSLSRTDSDQLLFALAVVMTVILTSCSATETNALAAIGAQRGVAKLSRGELYRLAILCATRSAILFPPALIIVVAVYASSSASRDLLLDAAQQYWPVILAPLVALTSPAMSAYLISRGSIGVVLAAAGLRTAPLLISVLAQAPPPILVTSVIGGEVLRTGLLAILSFKHCQLHSTTNHTFSDAPQLRVRAIATQTVWVATSQISLSFLRAVFASGPTGTFTAGETALRIQNVAAQLVVSAYTMPKIAEIPAQFSDVNGANAAARARTTMTHCFVAGLAVGGTVATAAVLFSLLNYSTTEVGYGAILGAILVISCAPLAASTWATRAIVYTGNNGALLLVGSALTALLGLALWLQTSMFTNSATAACITYVLIMTIGLVAYATIARKRLSSRSIE